MFVVDTGIIIFHLHLASLVRDKTQAYFRGHSQLQMLFSHHTLSVYIAECILGRAGAVWRNRYAALLLCSARLHVLKEGKLYALFAFLHVSMFSFACSR